MEPLKSFTALDFETFTAERSSACAIGLVKIRNGHVVHQFYSLINPIPDDRPTNNSFVHGITAEMVAEAPTFAQLWPLISGIIGDDTIVSHNASFDEAVWQAQFDHYPIIDSRRREFFCTFKLTGLPLAVACAKHDIEIGRHHNALDDALACANLLLAEGGRRYIDTFKGSLKDIAAYAAKKKYDKATLQPVDDSEVVDKSTPFFHARTVITGVFDHYPNRNDLGKKLQSLGADINTSISKKTNIVVMGSGAGPAKLKKVEELNASGCDIRIILENELISILEK